MEAVARRKQRRVPGRSARALRLFLSLLLARALYTLYRRQRVPRALANGQPRNPFLAFTGSGLLLAYYHGIATYIRDHFEVDGLRLSGISGGCSTILALAMGIDLYQILLVGLHMKQWILKQGVYLNSFEKLVGQTCEKFEAIGMTDADARRLASKGSCFIGVTQCCPPRHCCAPTPSTVRELAELISCSMCVVPFFSTPGVFQGKYYIDGGFSAMWSVPDDTSWSDVIKVTCMPNWCTWLPPAMSSDVDLQPKKFMPTEIIVLYPWAHQQMLIKRGYEDARRSHSLLEARGLRPLPNAPLTEWSSWQKLFAAIDENNLPPLSKKRSTAKRSELESKHDELLRTYSASDLRDALKGPRIRRLSSDGALSEMNGSEADLARLVRAEF